MKFQQLNIQKSSIQNRVLNKEIDKLNSLIAALEEKEVTQKYSAFINDQITALNVLSGTEKTLRKAIHNTYANILKKTEKELKYVAINHYRNMWMALGMSIFGLPFGIVFSVAIDNYGFIAIGLPIGMAIGMSYGITLDKKAEKDGLQLNITC